MSENQDIGPSDAAGFLTAYYNEPISNVELIGEGAWSRCFAFTYADEPLVLKVGRHLHDFKRDRWAAKLASESLPIPQMFDLGEAFGRHFAISTRVFGHPLEEASAEQWQSLIPSIVDALEAMRRISPPDSDPDPDGPPLNGWSEMLLGILNVKPERGNHQGWEQRLAQSPFAHEVYVWGGRLLEQYVDDAVPMSVLHRDLVNRNAFVAGNRLTGIFDWGCALYGDHLYDLAWFDFWSPWYPALDLGILHHALEARWREVDAMPEHKEDRLIACYLHIGIDHLIYNSVIDDETNLIATAQRMRALIPA